jgi:hypothetical protein
VVEIERYLQRLGQLEFDYLERAAKWRKGWRAAGPGACWRSSVLALGGTFADIPPSVEIQGKQKAGSCLFFFAGLLRVTSPFFARPGLNPDRFP